MLCSGEGTPSRTRISTNLKVASRGRMVSGERKPGAVTENKFKFVKRSANLH